MNYQDIEKYVNTLPWSKNFRHEVARMLGVLISFKVGAEDRADYRIADARRQMRKGNSINAIAHLVAAIDDIKANEKYENKLKTKLRSIDTFSHMPEDSGIVTKIVYGEDTKTELLPFARCELIHSFNDSGSSSLGSVTL
jgi:hypothetical protein